MLPTEANDAPRDAEATTTAPAMLGAQVFDAERRSLTIGILLTVTSFAVEGMGVVPALPTAVRDLGGLPLFGWAFSAFMLAWLVGTVAGGLLADARGPYRSMAAGLLGFGVGLVLAGLSRGMAQFLAGRALQGAGGGAMIAAAYVAIARAYPDNLRPRMMALTSSVWVLPAVLGPALSGAVAERVGWRFVFLGIVPLLIVVALVVLPQLGRFAVKRPLAGARRMASALRAGFGAALVLAAPSLYPREAAVAAAVVVGVVLLLPAFAIFSQSARSARRAACPRGSRCGACSRSASSAPRPSFRSARASCAA